MYLEESPSATIGARQIPPAVWLVSEAAALLGLSVELLDSHFGYLFELSDGQRSKILLGGRSPLNDAVAARLADDKYYTGLLLKRSGFRVPESVRCLKSGYFALESFEEQCGLAPAQAFADLHGFPLVVKPNRLSHGRHVQLVRDRVEMLSAIERVWELDYLALVQTAHPGIDIRLDFLDGEYLLGYTRRAERSEEQRKIEILNLALGAKAAVLETVPREWTECARRIARVLNLRYLGIDFKALGVESDPALATVIEVNASPLFVQLYLQGERELTVSAQARVLKAVWSLS